MIGRTLANRLRTAAAGGAPFFSFAFTGPTFFSRTTDNGDTWSTAIPIYEPGTNAQTINNIVQVLPTGDVLDVNAELEQTPETVTPDDVEAMMAQPWNGPSPRDTTKIDWYRGK